MIELSQIYVDKELNYYTCLGRQCQGAHKVRKENALNFALLAVFAVRFVRNEKTCLDFEKALSPMNCNFAESVQHNTVLLDFSFLSLAGDPAQSYNELSDEWFTTHFYPFDR